MEHLEFGDIAVDFEVTGQGDEVALLHAQPVRQLVRAAGRPHGPTTRSA